MASHHGWGTEPFEEEKILFTRSSLSQVIFFVFLFHHFLFGLILICRFFHQEVLEGKDQIRRLIAGERIAYDILREEPEAPVPRNICFFGARRMD